MNRLTSLRCKGCVLRTIKERPLFRIVGRVTSVFEQKYAYCRQYILQVRGFWKRELRTEADGRDRFDQRRAFLAICYAWTLLNQIYESFFSSSNYQHLRSVLADKARINTPSFFAVRHPPVNKQLLASYWCALLCLWASHDMIAGSELNIQELRPLVRPQMQTNVSRNVSQFKALVRNISNIVVSSSKSRYSCEKISPLSLDRRL